MRMHWMRMLLITAVASGMGVTGCLVESDGDLDPGDKALKDDEVVAISGGSEIAAVEASLGVSLNKETKTIRDELNNSVTLLVASQNGQVVADFLNNVEISIEPLRDMTIQHASETAPISADIGLEEPPNAAGLLLEVASRSFGPDTKAFTLKFKGKSAVGQTGDNFGAQIAEYESQLYVEGFKIDYLSFGCNSGGCDNSLEVQHWSRSCGLCNYKLYASHTLHPGESWASCNDSRRTKVKIFGSFSPNMYSWNFTFWNCS